MSSSEEKLTSEKVIELQKHIIRADSFKTCAIHAFMSIQARKFKSGEDRHFVLMAIYQCLDDRSHHCGSEDEPHQDVEIQNLKVKIKLEK